MLIEFSIDWRNKNGLLPIDSDWFKLKFKNIATIAINEYVNPRTQVNLLLKLMTNIMKSNSNIENLLIGESEKYQNRIFKTIVSEKIPVKIFVVID